MPLYEFRCLACNECFEFLVMKQEEQVELRCPKCQSEDFERVLSVSGHCMSSDSAGSQATHSKTRNCPGGSCTTYEISGPSR